jgi:hypothetical protein
MSRLLISFGLVGLLITVLAPPLAAQEADDALAECVPGHVGAQPVRVCMYSDDTAIAWRRGSSEPLSLVLDRPGVAHGSSTIPSATLAAT